MRRIVGVGEGVVGGCVAEGGGCGVGRQDWMEHFLYEVFHVDVRWRCVRSETGSKKDI